MKWYNYQNRWIDIEKVKIIALRDNYGLIFRFSGNEDDYYVFNYEDQKECNAEFEKIKVLMGVSIEQDWKPGRCC